MDNQKRQLYLEKKRRQLHQKACKERQFWYKDPESGYKVLTAFFLKSREYCCRSSCRHCPYGWNEDKAVHVVSGPIKVKTIQPVLGSQEKFKVVVIETAVGDLILTERDQNSADSFEAFKHLAGKYVTLEGIREYKYFFVVSHKENNANKTS